MELQFLLDTSVYCQPLKPRPVAGVEQRWRRLKDGVMAVPVICDAELRASLSLRDSKRLWMLYHRLLGGRFVQLPFDEGVASSFVDLVTQARRDGRPYTSLDLMVGATAKAHGLVIATIQPSQFEGMEGVAVEDWSRDLVSGALS